MNNIWMIDSLYESEIFKIKNFKINDISQKVDLSNYKSKPLTMVQGDKAIVDVSGVMIYSPTAFEEAFFQIVSTQKLINEVKDLEQNDKIKSVVFAVNSPGGQAQKVNQLADAVLSLSKKKQTVAVNTGVMASAAYYGFSQAGKIYADDNLNMTGSIGTKLIVYDDSGMFEKEGVKAIKIDTGEFKSLGEPGLPVTDADVKALQEIVNYLQSNFNHAVQRVRPNADMRDGSEARNGLAFFGQKAIQLGLIDGYKSISDVFTEMDRQSRINQIRKNM